MRYVRTRYDADGSTTPRRRARDGRRGRRSRALLALVTCAGVAATAGLVASPATSAPAHDSEDRTVYVAMGDSYSSGPVIPPQADAVTCLRSAVNYAGLVSRALVVEVFRDVTCSGATTADLTHAQPSNTPGGPPAPPQYAALSRRTTLVTVGIGGNDIGLIGLATGCVVAGLDPTGPTCQSQNGRTYEQRIDAFAATYGRVVEAVRARAPRARILLVGYPTTIRPGGCYPVQPVKPTDATYLRGSSAGWTAGCATRPWPTGPSTSTSCRRPSGTTRAP